MIIALIGLAAVQPLQSQPTARTIRPFEESARVSSLQYSKYRLLTAKSADLLARAEATRAGYEPKPGQPSRAELDAAMEALKAEVDSTSQMSDMTSLRLQMTMDRRSKLIETLSNILKKISDTENSLVHNVK